MRASGQRGEVNREYLRVAHLVKEGRGVADENLLLLGREIIPGPRAEDGLDELARTSSASPASRRAATAPTWSKTSCISGSCPGSSASRSRSGGSWTLKLRIRSGRRVASRRTMEPPSERPTMCGREIQVFDQGRQIGSVLFDAPLSGRTFALAVAAAVVGEDAEALGEGRHQHFPVALIRPTAVDQHERRSRIAGERVGQSDAVNGGGCHGVSFPGRGFSQNGDRQLPDGKSASRDDRAR